MTLHHDFPRERLLTYGAAAVGADELIALVLGTGSAGVPVVELARAILRETGGMANLARAPARELISVSGVGPARATRLAAAFELGRRGLVSAMVEDTLSTPDDVDRRLRPRLAGLPFEVFIAVAVDARNGVLAELEIARGSLLGVDVHPRELFRPLIRMGAAGCVVAHNHPSGDPEPSAADIALTRRLQEIGQMIGIPVLDHLVIGAEGFTSLAERLGA